MAKRLALLVLAAAVVMWLGECTDLDLRLAHAAFDPGTRTFPWRHEWLAEVFSHEILRGLLMAAGLGAWLLVLADAWAERSGASVQLSAWARARVRVLGGAALLVPSMVALLKRASASHCPWDLQAFGGTEVYVRLLQPALAGAGDGHCLPAGHASSALWLLAVVVFWLPHRPCKAALAGGLALALGLWMGWLQQLRGAHFFSHTLWTVWIACAVVNLLYWRLVELPAARQAGSALKASHAPENVVPT